MTRKIAIIGAGPAGYTLAQELVKAENEYQINIFDKEAEIGGAIYTGIPEYRMPKTFLEKAYNGLVEAGVKFHFNTFVDQAMFKELQADYDYVVVAIGAQIENTFGFETGNGVVAGLTLLYDLNINHKQADFKKYKKAIVWGGGNVAMDCARSLVRIIDDVTIVYRRSLQEMPASPAEIKACEKEGVKIAFLNNIKDILKDENGNVTVVHGTYDPETKSGSGFEGRKVKGTIHWVAVPTAKKIECRLYENIVDEEKGKLNADGTLNLNPNSLTILKECYGEPALAQAETYDSFQFVRNGYFCADCKDSTKENLVFNRIVSLKSSFKLPK